MKEFKASVVIQAPVEKIWTVLTDVSSWPQWDHNCVKVEGSVALGNKLKVFTKLSPGRAFSLKVTEFIPNRKMIWSGGMPFGLFKGERTFALIPKNDGSIEFVMHEVFSGPMLALIGKSIPDLTQVFNDYVAALKRQVEKS